MKYDPRKHQRHSIRLKGYDYAQPGAYFVTLCTWQREALFGEVAGGEVRLSPLGRIVQAEWERLASQFTNITLDAFVVMPNHVHGIIVIHDGATRRAGIDVLFGDQSGAPQINVGATQHDGHEALFGDPSGLNDSRDTQGGSPIWDIHGGSPEWGGSPAPKGPGRGSLGAMIGQFKSRVTKRIWAIPDYSHVPIWQRNYYEHIIRNEAEWGEFANISRITHCVGTKID